VSVNRAMHTRESGSVTGKKLKSRRRRPLKRSRQVDTPIWQEWLAGVELAFLQISPVYWGYGIPHGDGSAVVLVPGFLGTDFYLTQFATWLRRIGYKAFYSGIPLNADCPNLLISRYVNDAMQKAVASTHSKIHLIGHSLGGTLARSAAAQMPERVASVITMASPIQGLAARAAVMSAANMVRKQILERHGSGVLPNCYTPSCTCDFIQSLHRDFPKSVRQTAIYTKQDGILDWRMCQTGDADVDVQVSATHIGMIFSPLVYSVVARRLAGK